jgi:hypothetical protein
MQDIHTEFSCGKSLEHLKQRMMNRREINFEDGRWLKLAQDRVQWRVSILVVLKHRTHYRRGD